MRSMARPHNIWLVAGAANHQVLSAGQLARGPIPHPEGPARPESIARKPNLCCCVDTGLAIPGYAPQSVAEATYQSARRTVWPTARSPPRPLACPRSTPPSRCPQGGRWLRRFLAFAGPGYMVSVGYMDPGNWATDLAGGARFGYALLSVILLSNLMAILLQSLAARLGIATGRDLAQACRDSFPRPVNFALWLACEAAIIACDLAEVIGTAIALQLLFGIPLIAGAMITALDAFLLLLLMNQGFRCLEAFVIALLLVIAGCFAVQIAAAAPPVAAVLAMASCRRRRSWPTRRCSTSPSASSAPRSCRITSTCIRRSCRHARFCDRCRPPRRDPLGTADSTIALIAGAVRQCRHPDRGRGRLSRQRPYQRRRDRRGLSTAVAAARRSASPRRCSRWRCWPPASTRRSPRPWQGRSSWRASCGCASRTGPAGCSPAASPSCRSWLVTALYGESGTAELLVLSQVILSMQLPFAVIPLVLFVSDRRRWDGFVIPRWMRSRLGRRRGDRRAEPEAAVRCHDRERLA